MNTNEMLEKITHRNDTWRGRQRRFQDHGVSANSDCHDAAGLATGYATLDAQLQQGGWPLDSTIEAVPVRHGALE
jgi:hypothetical protein